MKSQSIRIGMSTAEIDDIVYTFTKEHGGIPAPLNYQGISEKCLHFAQQRNMPRYPDKNIILQDGDIINVDASTILNGYFSDASVCLSSERFPKEPKKSSA